MRILNGEYVKSILRFQAEGERGLAEISFVGRSNVGKSSTINTLVGRKIARTSSTPGATKAINLFRISYESEGNRGALIFSDFPGFGYAKVSRAVSAGWQSMIEDYVLTNRAIRTIIWLFDVRREMDDLDEMLFDWLTENNLAFCLVLTKADKESKSVVARKRKLLSDALGGNRVLAFSSKSGQGKDELLSYISESITA